jgi:hypothetical protein
MKLVEEWGSCWKWLSVQANTVGIAITSTYGLMYDELKDTLPPKWMTIAVIVVFALGIAGRLISQPANDDNK